MAIDLIKVLREIRGTGEPEAAYTDGIYHDIAIKTTNDDLSPRLGAGMYGSMQIMHGDLSTLISIYNELIVLEAMADVLNSLYTDKATLDSLYADKVTLDSLFTDKVTLDSLFADKITLDSLYTDKATLDSLFADKTALDSLFTDKATLDSLYADKATLDSIYADKVAIDAVYGALTAINAIHANINDVNYFADVYLGPKAVEPITRNDSSPLQSGDLYLDTSNANPLNHLLKVYTGSAWNAAFADTSIVLLKAENLNDLTDKQVARDNLGISKLADADKYLASLSITNINYTDGDPTTVVYEGVNNNDVITYGADGPTNIAHTVGGVLGGNTVISYVNGDPVSSVFTAV